MSRLKDNVPELDLCKQIPEGEFRNSVLVWGYYYAGWHDNREWSVFERTGEENVDLYYPAPTLAEIMAELPKYDENEKTLACIPDFPNESGEAVFGAAWTVGYTKNRSVTDKNPATAALKLWLELKGIEA